MSASIIASVVTGGSNSHQTVAEELNNVATDFVSQGVVGTFTSASPNTGAFGVTQNTGSDMAITILSGRAYVSGTPTGQDAQVLSARMAANYTGYTINANASGSTKYDWIYLQLSATNANTPAVAADNVITLVTSRSTSNASDNGSPPTYGIPLAIVTVANGATAITNGNITDKRVQSALSVQSATTTGWQTLANPLTYGANNGNKEVTVTTPSDISGTLSPGMKLKITRSVTPPTQSMAFVAASSQYATKATPSGLAFTAAFTCEAWVYLNSYQTNAQTIISRRSGTAGAWFLRASATTGTLEVGYGDGAANFTIAGTYQSIPLKRWVHVAGAVSSVSSKTVALYINGLQVPAAFSLSAATSLVQTGNLSAGCYGAGTGDFLDGYVSEARVWSVAQTASSIQSNMAVNLVGNETNLVSLFQGSGNFTDSTSNANTLTATNGAVSSQASNPYNATEYALITKVSYVNPNTTLTLSTGDTGTIPNQTLNSPNYSVAQEPYGLPNDLSPTTGRRLMWMPFLGAQATTSVSSAAFGGSGSPAVTFTVPGNCSTVKLKGFNTSVSNTTGGATTAFLHYNGTIAAANQVGQANAQATNAASSSEILVPVVPGSTFTWNIGWLVTSGTATWGASSSKSTDNGFWAETA